MAKAKQAKFEELLEKNISEMNADELQRVVNVFNRKIKALMKQVEELEQKAQPFKDEIGKRNLTSLQDKLATSKVDEILQKLSVDDKMIKMLEDQLQGMLEAQEKAAALAAKKAAERKANKEAKKIAEVAVASATPVEKVEQ